MRSIFIVLFGALVFGGMFAMWGVSSRQEQENHRHTDYLECLDAGHSVDACAPLLEDRVGATENGGGR